MKVSGIQFFTEQTRYTLRNRRTLRSAILELLKQEGTTAGAINFILCNDEYLKELNRTYLHRESYTDVIAFDFSEEGRISGDVYISIDRIRENAEIYSVTELEELYRVMIHGVLHLIGMTDANQEEKQAMRERENRYLDTLFTLGNQ